MGVHDLWSILGPVCESVPLYSLSGKTLAVDLSLWVCEAQHVQAMMGKVTKPHLRNLFFRVSSLTLMGIKLVFVMEGDAPKLKAETMSKRTEARFGGFKKASSKPATTKNTSRGRFKAVLRECADMLDCLGVPWVTAAGEAEEMCAYLDSKGLVDGCITNDGDAFLYGARTVYRNFNLNTKDPQVDCYSTARVQAELHLSRENLVGLAILLGCDYIPKGVPGVGKEQALRLIQTVKGHGQSLLQRFHQWRQENVAGMPEAAVKKVPHCNVCRHPGSAKAHERGGCMLCDSKKFCQPQDFDYQCPCDWHRNEHTRQASSAEASIRKKTLMSEQFPFTEIIKEFLVSKDKHVEHFRKRKPNMLLMQNFAHDKMDWPKNYTCEKVLVLMTYTELMNRKCGRETTSQIKPLRILKPRVRNAVACFEVVWRTPDHYVFPEDHPAVETVDEVRTVEEEALFCLAYPEIVETYLRNKALAEENKTKKRKPRNKKATSPDPCDGVSDLLAQMTLKGSTSAADDIQPQALLPSITNPGERKPRNKKATSPDPSDGVSDLLAQMNLKGSTSAADSIQPQAPLPSITNPGDPEVAVLKTPVSNKHYLNPIRDQHVLGDRPVSQVHDVLSTLSPTAFGTMTGSPCVSAVIDALHLSDIDWESFTASPPPQAAILSITMRTAELKPRDAAGDRAKVAEAEGPKHQPTTTEGIEDALHLSDIDWDTLSFTSSPPPQAATLRTAELKARDTAGDLAKIAEAEGPKHQPTTTEGREAESKPAPKMCYTECPLRDRVLMRNTLNEARDDVATQRSHHVMASMEPVSFHDKDPKSRTKIDGVCSNDTKPSGKHGAFNRKVSLNDKIQSVTSKIKVDPPYQKSKCLEPLAQNHCRANTNNAIQKPPQNYTFVKGVTSSVPTQRCHSDRKVSQTTKKKSVCLSVASSSEDSDAENKRVANHRKAKVKPKSKLLTCGNKRFPLKPTRVPSTSTKQTLDTHNAQSSESATLTTTGVDVDVYGSTGECSFLSNKSMGQDIPPVTVDDNVFTLTSPVSVLDSDESDDSVNCGDSPLPLAERLRLRFLK